MTEADYHRKLDQLEHLLNDPDQPLMPGLVWRLAREVSEYIAQADMIASPVCNPQNPVANRKGNRPCGGRRNAMAIPEGSD